MQANDGKHEEKQRYLKMTVTKLVLNNYEISKAVQWRRVGSQTHPDICRELSI